MLTQPLLLLSSDEQLHQQIKDAAGLIGLPLHRETTPAALTGGLDPARRPIALTEPLEGSEAVFVDRLTRLRPCLLLIDARQPDFPWKRWTQIIQTSAATRRIPLLLLGSDAELGTAGVTWLSRLPDDRQSLADLLQRLSRSLSLHALTAGCEGELSPLAAAGLALLNEGHFYDAHEPLEQAWMAADEEEGRLYRALLQFAVACHHLSTGNRRGARKLILRLRQWLDPLPDRCRGVDVVGLREQTARLQRMIASPQPPSEQRLGALLPIRHVRR